MKLSPIKNFQTFKGYDACPIKKLYMQSSSVQQKAIFEELCDIGKKENFDVFMHGKEDSIVSNPENFKPERSAYNRWAQDNKIFIEKDGKEYILYPKFYPDGQNKEALNLSKLTGITANPSNIIIEGGNMFLGKKNNGEKYIIMGYDTMECTAVNEFLKEQQVEDLDDEVLTDFLRKGQVRIKNSFLCTDYARIEDYYTKRKFWVDKAKKLTSKELGIRKENIFVISQPNFHIDMGIRPLEYPYILVNDAEIAKENLGKIDKEGGFKKIFNVAPSFNKEYYSTGSEIAKELREQGFTPILIGAVYGKNVNFLNAIINKHEDGSLSYISNSSECNDDRYQFLQDLFKEDLRKRYKNIKDFYFVKGRALGKSNDMMSNLSELQGGIHCLCAEVPDFN